MDPAQTPGGPDAGAGGAAELAQGGPAASVAEPSPQAEEDKAPPRSLAHVTLHPPALHHAFRWEAETLGLVTALVELGLSDLADVVVEVPGVPLAPGATDLLPIQERWTARLDVGTDPDALTIRLDVCDAALLCTTLEHTATREHPESAVAALVLGAAGRLRHEPAPGAIEGWAAPLSGDDYAVLMAGRSAATWYGLRPRVDEGDRLEKNRDPIARAVYIDPSVAVAQWLLGREHGLYGDWSKARVAFTAGALGRGASPMLSADEAMALTLQGTAPSASAAWDAILDRHPGDLRFLLPQARAALAADRVPEAHGLVEFLALRWGREPAVAELRVRVADASGVPADPDPLLASWQEADPTAAEPVRRRVYLRIRDARLEEALALIPELANRGQVAEADRLRMAVAVGLERWDEAASAADALGDAVTAARIRGRGALASGGELPAALLQDPDPEIGLVVGEALLAKGQAAEALARAQAARKLAPWSPEALALEARSLRALGRDADAVKVEAVLHDVEPGRG